jgi:hypothetical protein
VPIVADDGDGEDGRGRCASALPPVPAGSEGVHATPAEGLRRASHLGGLHPASVGGVAIRLECLAESEVTQSKWV